MNYKKILIDLRKHEGLRLKPYICSSGKLTIGIGRNLDDVGITENEANYLLNNDILRVINELTRNIPWWNNINDFAQRALVNMCFNLGWTSLSEFKKMLFALKNSDYERAAIEALDSKWAKQVGNRANEVAEMMKKTSNV